MPAGDFCPTSVGIRRNFDGMHNLAVEEEVLLSCIDVCVSYMQVDIQDVYRFATIDGDYRFGNVTDEDEISDLEAPTECEDEEKVSELRASCASEV